jgi:hypothetical protein
MKKKTKTARRSREIQSTNGAAPEETTSDEDTGGGETTTTRPKLLLEERTALGLRLVAKKEKLDEALAKLAASRESVEAELGEVAKEFYEKIGNGAMTRNGVSFCANKLRGARGSSEREVYYFRNINANALSLD